MVVAIMQPYLFPYIGYYQLLSTVDKFIIYDDVTFIKQGWINRNQILSNGQPSLFTLPLTNTSSNKLIRDVYIHDKLFEPWKTKFLRTLSQSYSKAPHVAIVVELVSQVLEKAPGHSISEVARESLLIVHSYLGFQSDIIYTSGNYGNNDFSGQKRVVDICLREGATSYINPIGGQSLYDKETFAQQNLELSFIRPRPILYKQFKNNFYPWLSIVDVLMFNSIEDTRILMTRYDLV